MAKKTKAQKKIEGEAWLDGLSVIELLWWAGVCDEAYPYARYGKDFHAAYEAAKESDRLGDINVDSGSSESGTLASELHEAIERIAEEHGVDEDLTTYDIERAVEYITDNVNVIPTEAQCLKSLRGRALKRREDA